MILELAETVARVVGVESRLKFDPRRPNGAPRKLLDSARLRALGWRPKTSLEDGLRITYRWYLENVVNRSERRA